MSEAGRPHLAQRQTFEEQLLQLLEVAFTQSRPPFGFNLAEKLVDFVPGGLPAFG
jgi:hypothetical protein